MKKLFLLAMMLLFNSAWAGDLYVYKNKGNDISLEKSKSDDFNEYQSKVNVQYYGDETGKKKLYGSESAGHSWANYCEQDQFTNVKRCSAHKDGLSVLIIDGKYSISIGYNYFPNSTVAIKIDNNKTFSSEESKFKNVKSIIAQMKKGKVALTRFQEWPYQSSIDKKVDLSGFSEALGELKDMYKRL